MLFCHARNKRGSNWYQFHTDIWEANTWAAYHACSKSSQAREAKLAPNWGSADPEEHAQIQQFREPVVSTHALLAIIGHSCHKPRGTSETRKVPSEMLRDLLKFVVPRLTNLTCLYLPVQIGAFDWTQVPVMNGCCIADQVCAVPELAKFFQHWDALEKDPKSVVSTPPNRPCVGELVAVMLSFQDAKSRRLVDTITSCAFTALGQIGNVLEEQLVEDHSAVLHRATASEVLRFRTVDTRGLKGGKKRKRIIKDDATQTALDQMVHDSKRFRTCAAAVRGTWEFGEQHAAPLQHVASKSERVLGSV